MSLSRSPQFRRLFIAQTVSRWGDTFNFVALVILVFRLTGSGLKVAGMVAFEIAPVLILGPIAGALADRRSRVRVMINADLVRAALVSVLVLTPHHLWIVYAVAFGLSAGSVFFNPASNALLPSIVVEGQLVGANSALWSTAVISQIALAPLAGLMIAAVGTRPAFAINAASFLFSAAILSRLPRITPTSTVAAHWRTRVREGFRFARENQLIRVLVQVQALAALSAGGTSALLVVLARERLGVGPAGFGILLAAIGVGAAIGPLLLKRFVKNPRTPLFLFAPYLLRGGVDAVLVGTTISLVAGGALAIYGVGTSIGMVVYNSVIQSRVPEEFRGRAFALFDVVWQSGRLLSLVAGGLLADAYGIRAVYAIGAVLLILAGVRGFVGITQAQLE